jgi:hypothetical protein
MMQPIGATSNNPDFEIASINRGAAAEAAIHAAMYKAHRVDQDSRPKNTKIQYNSKQKAWERWCEKHEFLDTDTVSEGKLIYWLDEAVVPNGRQGKGVKRGTILSTSGLEGYIKPIIALWEVYFSLLWFCP